MIDPSQPVEAKVSTKPGRVRHPYQFSAGLPAANEPTTIAAVLAPVAVLIGWLIIAQIGPGAPKVTLVVKDGFSAFALFYIAAQLIERILEPVTGIFPTDKTMRMLYLWATASILGMVFSSAFGLYFVASILASGSIPPDLDLLFTGIVIGGGSKALHDLVSSLQ